MKRLLLSVSLLVASAVAFAQEAVEIGTDPTAWFADPKLGIAAVIAFTHWLRLRFPDLDGPVVVPSVAIAAGVAGGALGQFVGIPLVPPFPEFGMFGGAAYGLFCAVGAVLGVNFFDLLSSRVGKTLIGLLRGGDKTVDPDPAATAAASRLRR